MEKSHPSAHTGGRRCGLVTVIATSGLLRIEGTRPHQRTEALLQTAREAKKIIKRKELEERNKKKKKAGCFGVE